MSGMATHTWLESVRSELTMVFLFSCQHASSCAPIDASSGSLSLSRDVTTRRPLAWSSRDKRVWKSARSTDEVGARADCG